ncbi:helix-turn-helix domain-containing protein [Frisingicoccus sp.]|uniref:helix-turn-helix domain-containing protein n=1 Tax=Frisingicoccus sp. TaxID=1918627 RepID=UPI0038676263
MGIGSKLTKLMKERNTNANELSSKAGVPATTIYSLIKRDSNRVDIDSLIKIARALGVTAEYFCNEDQPTPTTIAAHKEDGSFTPEELEKIEEYKKLLIAARPRK